MVGKNQHGRHVIRRLDHAKADRRLNGKIERGAGRLRRKAVEQALTFLGRTIAQVEDSDRLGVGWLEAQDGDAVLYDDSRMQNFVSLNDPSDRTLRVFDDDRLGEPQQRRQVKCSLAGLQPFEQPKTLLEKRQRQR